MAVQTTYPGVYIEELPSSQHTIPSVATSITAFIGRAPIGSIDEPMLISNFGDFQRFYGGLAHDFPMSYAVQDYFLNGGSQAYVARLFEPKPGKGSGVAKLPFPVSPPPLPDRWRLELPAAPGATTISIEAPTGGSIGEPEMGLTFTIGADVLNVYTVASYTSVDGTTPAKITFFPALPNDPGAAVAFGRCAELNFSQGPTPIGWQVAEDFTKSPLKISGGEGLPQLGDTFTVGKSTEEFVIEAVPAVNIGGASTTVTLHVTSPAGVKPSFLMGSPIRIAPPKASPMPIGWQIDDYLYVKGTAQLTLVNGIDAPLANDQFTVGNKAMVYTVVSYSARTTGPKAKLATLVFTSKSPLPTQQTDDLCFCCTLRFTRPAPQEWVIKTGTKADGTSLTVGNSGGAASGVIDVGDTFRIEGDPTVYTVRTFDRSSNQIQFLPKANTDITASSEIVFSPPLALEAANPGGWGNSLTAVVNTNGITADLVKGPAFKPYGLQQADLFNLTVELLNSQGLAIQRESYVNVSVRHDAPAASYPKRLDRVLEQHSMLARVAVLAMVPPSDGAAAQGASGYDGGFLSPLTYMGNQQAKTGMYLLENAPVFNLLCIPPDGRLGLRGVPSTAQDLGSMVRLTAAEYCTNRRAMFIVDPPPQWSDLASQGLLSTIDPSELGINGMSPAGIEKEANAAVYFPKIYSEDLLANSKPELFAACGMIAGVIAATDVSRGVWKAPAGTEAGLSGVTRLEFNLTNEENGILNPLGINCLRTFPVVGPIVWGARTLRGADQFESSYKYLPVRRLTLFVEDSLYLGTQWAVFEPNDEALWSSLRLSVGNFLASLAREGAFYNYTVKCDGTTTTAEDIALGQVNILVQIAPVDPAEFVVIEIQQGAAQSSS